ncbi:MAG TPA: carbamoyltransferase C-terminal domain-containing protein [Lunatimonas sp.]|nr:carbamoyltransferase C-terminal domain-containing protein [Lunatimonas sp.]
MIVLGIHEGHDSCAAIIKDGVILADVQEERFSRVKHSSNAPLDAIQYCLEIAGLKDINEVDKISLSWSFTPIGLKALFGRKDRDPLMKSVAEWVASSVFDMTATSSRLKMPIYKPDYSNYPHEKIVNNDHHLAHAASAYFTQKSSEKQLVFTIDGAGDHTCTAIWLAEGSSIKLLKKYFREASIGWAYSVVTEGLNWIHGDGEGKTMGLAPYGDYTKCKGVLDKYFPDFKGNKLVKHSELGNDYFWEENGSEQYHFEEAKEVAELIKKYGRENIAAEAQRKLEDNVINLVEGWVKETGIKDVSFAGGVMLNVKLNQRIWEKRKEIGIENQHIFPNPGDSGIALGAALLEYYKNNNFEGAVLDNIYLGPEYSNEYIKEVLDIRKIKYTYLEDPTIVAAKLLAENKILAWFQGRMESGPRALGNRSILMSPLDPENKKTINAWVKFREGFRPFCPSLTVESKDEYLKDNRDEPFMITSFDVTEDKKLKIPAVVHVDGTLRPQLVTEKTNPRYWKLIDEFRKLTGESILLNTSFNVMGEPIVCNPKEAIRCFFDSGIDALFLGNYYVDKSNL